MQLKGEFMFHNKGVVPLQKDSMSPLNIVFSSVYFEIFK